MQSSKVSLLASLQPEFTYIALEIPTGASSSPSIATEKLEHLIGALLPPPYFTLSCLSTNLDLLNSGITWAYVVTITVCAFSTKVLGATLAARLNGLVGRESFAMGALMRSKALIELIVLNIGLQARIPSKTTFTIFVIALLTTFIQSSYSQLSTTQSITDASCYSTLRQCAANCLGNYYDYGILPALNCPSPVQNECFCRTDLIPTATTSALKILYYCTMLWILILLIFQRQ